jgi:type VI secretion system protein ImpA
MGTIDELLRPVSPKATCGVLDLVSDGQLGALEQAIKGRPAKTQFKDGETVVIQGAQEPSWSLLEKSARGLFLGGRIPDLTRPEGSETEVNVQPVKHLKAAMVLTLAELELTGIAGFTEGLELIARLLTEHWDEVHPTADHEDPEDPFIARFNILAPLAIAPLGPATSSGSVSTEDSWHLYERLLAAPLLNSTPQGSLNVRDCISPWATGLKLRLPPGEEITAERVREVRLSAPEIVARQRQVLQAATAAVEKIDAAFAKAPGTIKPDLQFLLRLLKGIASVLSDDKAASESVGAPKEVVRLGVAATGDGLAGLLSSREEAVRKLGEVAEYFRQHEPSSPIPQIIDRVRALVGKNFLALVDELGLGEQAVQEFRKLAGLRDPSGSAGTTKAASPSEQN